MTCSGCTIIVNMNYRLQRDFDHKLLVNVGKERFLLTFINKSMFDVYLVQKLTTRWQFYAIIPAYSINMQSLLM